MTQSQAAALLSVAPRSLRDWHDAPRNADGSYPGPALVAYYVARLTGSGEYDNQRERLAAAQAEKVEHDNAVRRGELVTLPDAEAAWGDCITNARAKLLGLPATLSARVPADVRAVVLDEARHLVHAALTELAAYDPRQ
jgi:phage terminase Nu1 subunit (DNA packaging protein)